MSNIDVLSVHLIKRINSNIHLPSSVKSKQHVQIYKPQASTTAQPWSEDLMQFDLS